MPMQAFAISKDGKSYHRVLKDLPYQQCEDASENPYPDGSFSFVVGRLQVARYELNGTKLDSKHGVEFVVSRPNANSLKGKAIKNVVAINDEKAYWLHMVNAYAGTRLLEMHIQRGKFKERVPLSKTFRLARTEPITVHLTDGFQPRRANTYFLITTGADIGLRGQSRNVGLLAHEVGSWVVAEEMSGQGPPPPPTGPPMVKFEDDDDDDDEHSAAVSWLISGVKTVSSKLW